MRDVNEVRKAAPDGSALERRIDAAIDHAADADAWPALVVVGHSESPRVVEVVSTRFRAGGWRVERRGQLLLIGTGDGQ